MPMVTWSPAIVVSVMGSLQMLPANQPSRGGSCKPFHDHRPAFSSHLPSRLTPPRRPWDDRGRKATEGWIAMADVPEDVQRWTAKRRVALALRHRPRETSVAEA